MHVHITYIIYIYVYTIYICKRTHNYTYTYTYTYLQIHIYIYITYMNTSYTCTHTHTHMSSNNGPLTFLFIEECRQYYEALYRIESLLTDKSMLLLNRTWFRFMAHTSRLRTIWNSSSRKFNAVFWLPKAPGIHEAHIHICADKIHTHVK